MKISSFIHIFFYPKKILEENMKKFDLILPVIIIGLCSAILAALAVLALPSVDTGGELQYLKTIMLIFAVFLGVISPLLGVVINSLINYILLTIVDSYVEFRKLMIIGFYAYMPILVDSLLKLIVSINIGKIFPYSPTSIAILSSKHDSLFSTLANSFSICGIWSLFIYALGAFLAVKESNYNKRNKAVIIIVCTNIIFTVLVGILFSQS
ncbi:YIP1 family protein [Bacillus cereus]|uniref:YIP1 family protein n=1 Tax=Bacillus cereus TaxID=1396 RepID=UPI0027F8E725|nr:YIP1 family protein [Bacillus cereus]